MSGFAPPGPQPCDARSPAARNRDLLLAHFRVNLARHAAYPVSLILEQLSYLVGLVVSLVLWRHLFTRLPTFAGWSFDDVLVLHLFGNLFLALFHSLFMGFHSFHAIVRNGRLDTWLARPVDPRIAHLAASLKPEELLNRLLALVPLVLYIRARGIELDAGRLAAGLAAMLVGLAAFACIQLVWCYAAFWLDKSDAILAFLDLFYGFYRFPLDALPGVAQLALTLAAPLLLAVTYPARFAAGGASWTSLLAVCAASLAVLAGWAWAQERLWRAGLDAYQSPGG